MLGSAQKATRKPRTIKKVVKKPAKRGLAPGTPSLLQLPGYRLIAGALRIVGRTVGKAAAFDLFRCDAVDRAVCLCRKVVTRLLTQARPEREHVVHGEDPAPHFVHVPGGTSAAQRELLAEFIRGARWCEQVYELVGIEQDGTIIHVDVKDLCPTSSGTFVLLIMGTPVREGMTYERIQEFLRDAHRDHEEVAHMRQLLEVDLDGKRFRYLSLFLFDTRGLIVYSVSFEYPAWNGLPRDGCLAKLGELIQQTLLLHASA